MHSNYVLVTGAAGFIGSQLVQQLLNLGRNVIAIDCFLPDLYSSEVKRERWNAFSDSKENQLIKHEFDLRTDDFSLLNPYSIDSIFNQAAMPGLSKDWSKFAPYYECNISALNRLLEYAKTLNLRSFVQASTSSVYGKNAIGDESQELKPTSPYGVSKLAAEKLLLAYMESFSTPVKILRYFSVYGPNQRPDMAYSKIIDCIINEREFTLYGDGEQQRSNTYIDDVIKATLLAESKALHGDIINICGNDTLSLNESIKIIEELLGKKMKRKQVERRKGDQKDTSGDNKLAYQRLGWRAEVSFQEGIQSQVSSAINSISLD